MPTPQQALNSFRRYIRQHPEELGRAVRSALGLRFGVPLAALRWLGQLAEGSGKVKDLKIDSVPPGLRVAGHFDMMKTPVRASTVIYIERVVFNDSELSIAIRLEDLDLKLDGDSETPVAALIKSGALDLSNPGTLLNFMPNRSPVIAEANGNRIVLDFMRDPKVGNNPLVRRAVGLLTSFVTLHGLETDTHHLDIAFRALPDGVGGAVRAVRKNVVSAVRPSVARLLPKLR
jgi:hypothetical protein